MKSILEQIAENNAEVEKLRQQTSTNNRKLLGQAVQQIFEENQDWLTSFSWTQYTPYFNDGDACTFGINLGYPEINEESWGNCDYVREFSGWGSNRKPNPKYDPAKVSVINNLQRIIGSVGTECLESIFGDHAKITVTKDGFKVKQYDHD